MAWHNKAQLVKTMIIVKERDYLEVKLASLIADYDRETIVNLYQPIIGFEAAMLYFTLWSEANNQKISSMITHGQLIDRMKITVSDFVKARYKLEGIGLVKTFIQKNKDVNTYHYDIYAPKSPYLFFNNALFYGMLIKEIGENEANKTKALYQMDISLDKGEDISSSFVEAYQPNFDDPVFVKALNNKTEIMGRRSGKLVSEFSYEKFVESLKNISQINPETFMKKEMKEIERLATLNGVNEETAARLVAEIYDINGQKGRRIDFNRLSKLFMDEDSYRYLKSIDNSKKNTHISSTSPLGSKINLMETVSPKDYLSILQNGSKPATADLKIINDLSSDFHLPNSVINALVDYVLATNNNILSRAYIEKVAASLAREGITNTVDAMNYLNKVNRSTNNRGSKKEQQEEITESNETISESWDDLLKEIEDNHGEN